MIYTRLINIRVTDEQYETLEQRRKDKTLSSYVRKSLFEKHFLGKIKALFNGG